MNDRDERQVASAIAPARRRRAPRRHRVAGRSLTLRLRSGPRTGT